MGLREEAELYVVNTCSVTARADASARKAIRRLHAEHPQARILVTGCYAQRAPQEIEQLPGVSLILGAADRADVVRELESVRAGELRRAVSPIGDAVKFLDVSITEMMEHSRAYVKVQEGCNEACTFCIVPQTRGRSRSREPERVLAQVQELVGAGYAEVVITGVHVGDYGLDLTPGRRQLTELLRRILDVSGVQRLRLSSIEPASVSPELVDLVASEPRFARHFHIPFQSGSNRVLERMRRRYRVEQFVELIESISQRIPRCGIGADVICGFPGETDEDFQCTFDRLVELPITYVHPFTYSVRPGSQAESFRDQIPGDVKKRRTRSLKRLSRDKTRAFQEQHVGEVMPVLLESESRPGAGVAGASNLGFAGWTDNYLRVETGAGKTPAGIEPVRITALGENHLVGERA